MKKNLIKNWILFIKLSRTIEKMNKDKSLISLSVPWTLLIYMLDFKVNRTVIDIENLIMNILN